AAVRDVAAIGGAVRPAGIAFIAIALLGAMALLGIAATATWTSLPTQIADRRSISRQFERRRGFSAVSRCACLKHVA
ncbi:hypothetical protein, partial [Mesorhizobium sp.]|uniref:hypothetical protein n=1 Tax=Mesorhizobium sp. TaxID=1871066 RepID=UPI0025CC6C41